MAGKEAPTKARKRTPKPASRASAHDKGTSRAVHRLEPGRRYKLRHDLYAAEYLPEEDCPRCGRQRWLLYPVRDSAVPPLLVYDGLLYQPDFRALEGGELVPGRPTGWALSDLREAAM